MGRMAVMKRHVGMTSSYQCQTCPCAASYTGLEVRPSSASVAAGSTTQYTARAWYGGCVAGYYSEPASATWWSGNTGIATVNGSGLVTGVAGGSATIYASKTDFVYAWYYGTLCGIGGYPTYYGSASCKVLPYVTSISPTSLKVGSSNVQIRIDGEGFSNSATITFHLASPRPARATSCHRLTSLSASTFQ